MRTRLALVCLAATAAALRPGSASAWRAAHSSTQRTMSPLAQQLAQAAPPGWITGIDPASGMTYYYNEQTGQSQWEPPQGAVGQQGYGAGGASSQQGYGTGLLWRVTPGYGVKSEYIVRPGEKQVLGRYDMFEMNPYVSRSQSVVEVDVNGRATLFSIGKPATMLRSGQGFPWQPLRMDESRVLGHGEQVSIVEANPESAFFIITCEQEGAHMGSGGGGGGGYQNYYSDDGQWMWNGSEWVPAR